MKEILDVLLQAPIATLVTSQSGLVLYYNNASKEILGIEGNKPVLPTAVQEYFSLNSSVTDQVCSRLHNDQEQFLRVRSLQREDLTYHFIDDITAQKNKEQKLTAQSLTDALSGLANRRHFDSQLSQEVSRASRYGTELSLLILDHDKFKAVNDSYGHPVGDKLILWSAQNLTSLVRSTDTAYRIGGDEFAVISPTRLSSELMDRISSFYSSEVFPEISRPVTLSIGAAEYNAGMSAENLYTKADNALLVAKSSNRK